MARYINIDDFKEFLPEHLVASFDGYFEENKLQMYKDVRIDENGNETVRGYRFGEPWVAMALYTEGGYKTQTEALTRWYNELQEQGQTNS